MQHKTISKIVVLATLLALVISAVGATPAQAWGPFSHNELARQAFTLMPKSELTLLLSQYQGSVLAGSVYPDWGMAYGLIPGKDKTKFDNLSEYAHWPQFVNAYLRFVKQNYSYPYDDPEEGKAIAFMFGLIAHNVGDPFFHDYLLPYIQTNEIQNFGQPGHTDVEFGVDVFNIYHGMPCSIIPSGCAYKYADVDWYLPEAPLMAAYAEMYANGVSAYSLTDVNDLIGGWDAYRIASSAQIYAESPLSQVTYYSGRLYHTYWDAWYYNLHPGGMADTSGHIADSWKQTWDWMNTYTFATAIDVAPAVPGGNNGWYKQPVTITLTPADNFEGTEAWLQTTFKTYYSLDGGNTYQEYTGPVTISAGGTYPISYYSVDSMGITEQAQNITLFIDLTPPDVTIWTDQPQYTRVEPFIVHFTGADAVSGLASLTAQFNGQAVTNGQEIDLFLLPTGSYTLAVRAEDMAGHVTEASQSIILTATLDSLKATVARLCAEGTIKKDGVCTDLTAKLNAAIAAQGRGNDKVAANLLLAFEHAVKAQAGKAIPESAANLLLLDSRYLREELNQ